MKPNIIFFDIDGTLINEKTYIVSDSTKEAIKKAKKNGHHTILSCYFMDAYH